MDVEIDTENIRGLTRAMRLLIPVNEDTIPILLEVIESASEFMQQEWGPEPAAWNVAFCFMAYGTNPFYGSNVVFLSDTKEDDRSQFQVQGFASTGIQNNVRDMLRAANVLLSTEAQRDNSYLFCEYATIWLRVRRTEAEARAWRSNRARMMGRS